MSFKKVSLVTLGVALALTLLPGITRAGAVRPSLVHPLTGQQAERTFVVTSTADNGNDANAPAGTFRNALVEANKRPGLDAIVFDLPGSGVKTITVKNYFGDIADDSGVIIDATQGDDRIEIDGSQVRGHHGIRIVSNNNVIRGLTINGVNDGAGISIEGGNNNVLAGNFIGTNTQGTGAKANHSAILLNNAHNNVIGGTNGISPGGACTGDCNLLSGNRYHGIVIDKGSSNNRMVGNFVGLNVNGGQPLFNAEDGVLIADSPNNVIGGTSPQERNILAGNRVVEIELGLNGTHGNLIQGNWLGMNSAGTALIQSGKVGIIVGTGAHDNVLDGNVIAGHGDYGILSFLDAARTEIKNNRIGIGPAADTNFGSGIRAIEIMGNGNYIHHNRMLFNAKGGIRIKNGMNNRISQNQIYRNNTLGINVHSDAFTPNDPGDGDTGANGKQNFPDLTGANNSNGTLTVTGNLNSRPNSRFIIELFHNDQCGDAFGKPVGEGQTFLTTFEVTTDGAGNRGFSVNVDPRSGGFITATATDAQNNTSEFSFCRQVTTQGPTKPAKPELLSPSNTATANENPPLLDWKSVDGVSKYRVQIRLESKKGLVVHKNKNVTTDQYRPPRLNPGNTYFWRVIACNAAGCTKSTWFQFRIP